MDIELYTHWVSTNCTMIQQLIQHLGGNVILREICVFPTDENMRDRSQANLNIRSMERINFFAADGKFGVPMLVIDRKKVTTDTKVILKYLAEKFCEDEPLYAINQRDEIDASLVFMVDTLGELISEIYYSNTVSRENRDPQKVESLNKTLEKTESFFDENFYLCGNSLTIVDFCLAVITSTLEMVDHDLTNYPKTIFHLTKCKECIRGWDECASFRINRFGHWYRVAMEANECGGCPYFPRPPNNVEKVVPSTSDLELYTSSLLPKSLTIQLLARILDVELLVKRVDLCHKEENVENRKEADENLTEMLMDLHFSDNEEADVPPVLISDGKVFVQTENILQYLLAEHETSGQQLYPSDVVIRGSVDKWLSHAVNELEMLVLETYVHSFENAYTQRVLNQGKVATIKMNLQKIADNLEGTDFLAGNYLTIADIAYAVTLSFLEVVGPEIFGEFEKVSMYLKTCKSSIKDWDHVCGSGLTLLGEWYRDLLLWTQDGNCPFYEAYKG